MKVNRRDLLLKGAALAGGAALIQNARASQADKDASGWNASYAGGPGDWAMHCHMTHHVMNQMGHGIPNMIGLKPGDLDARIRPLLPRYMTMGQHGMGDMAEMGMPWPENSIPMVGARGPHDYITMGGMFTILKVRENLANYDDPGWFKNPPGTQSTNAALADLQRDGIKP